MTSKPQWRYALRCWETTNQRLPPDGSEYGNDLDDIDDRAVQMLRGGRFKAVVICEWDADLQRWRAIRGGDLSHLPENFST